MTWVKVMAIGFASVVLASATPVAAHGPTVEITPGGFKPLLLNLFEGTTVHFTNSAAAAESVVVQDEARTFTSPAIAAGSDGWHYTFEQLGTHEIRIVERPEAKMRIVIVKKPTS